MSDSPGRDPGGPDLEAVAAPSAVAAPDDPWARLPATPRRRHRLRDAGFLVAFAGAAFLVGLLLFNNLLMPRLIHSGGDVRVPDVVGLPFGQSEQIVRDAGLQISRAGERFDPTLPAGHVLSQDPGPGSEVRSGRLVLVTVSLGEEFSSVPALYGESLRGARLIVERAGLIPGAVTRAPHEDVGEGLVAGSDPPPESVLGRDAPVALLVSTGPGPEVFVMPDLLGREIEGVRRQLEAYGFRVVVPAGAGSVGAVVFQDPGAGSRMSRDKPVTLRAMGRRIP